MRSWWAITLGLALLSGSAAAQSRAPRAAASTVPPAPPPEPTPAERVSKLKSEGNEAMLAMRYADALEAYRGALAVTPDDAGLSYSIARAEQFLGHYPEALDALDAFQAHASPEAKARVGKLDDLFAEIRPRVSTLTLTCSQPGARVVVRDRILGVTPLPPTRLPAGASTIQVDLDGFFPETRDVVLPGAGDLAIEVALHPRSTSGQLAVTSEPLGATITVDGRPVGTTSPRIELALSAGPHEVVAEREGYDDAKIALMLAPGATRDVSLPLDRSRPVTTRWWFWGTLGLAVAGGVALTYALTTEKSAGHGTLSPGQVGGP